MTYSPCTIGLIDSNNTTATPLVANATFNGSITDVSAYSCITINSYSDVESLANGLKVQFSTDGTYFWTSTTITIIGGITNVKSISVQAKYYRIQYTNGSTNQSIFTLQSNLQPQTSIITNSSSVTSQSNSNSGTLGTGLTWTGIFEDVSPYSQIITSFKSSQAGTFLMQFSTLGITADRQIGPYTLNANTDSPQPLAPIRKFYRCSYTNTSGSTAQLAIETRLLATPAIVQTRVTDPLTSLTAASTARVVLYGASDSGNYKQASITNDGFVRISIKEPTSIFGEINTIQPYPIAQIDFVYNVLNINNVFITTANGGTVTASDQLAVCTSGNTNGGSAILQSLRQLVYRPGQGGLARITALFQSGVANTIQIAGLGSTTNGYFFGYNGSVFGILHRNGGVDTWIPKTSWNQDVMDGSLSTSNPSGMLLNPTFGNIYQIKYQYLGFGNIRFYVENPASSEFAIVHTIKYSNTNTSTNLTNPTMQLYWQALCNSGGVGVTVKTGSGALFIEGIRQFLGPRYGIDNNKSGVSTLTNIITLKCVSTYNSLNNLSQVRIRNISAASANSGTAGISVLQVIINPTLGGTPSYTNIDSLYSTIQYDTAGTTVSGGIVIFNTSYASNGNMFMDVTELGLIINPSSIMTFAVKSTQNTTASISVCWSEDI